jgi:flagellin-like protein
MKSKRGISPVIATVLLISIALVIGAIIFIWASFFIKDAVQKNGESIDAVCERVQLDSSISGNSLSIVNNGDVPVYKIALNVDVNGDGKNIDVVNYESPINLGSGQSTTISVDQTPVSITPILRATKKGTETEYTCEKRQISVSSD